MQPAANATAVDRRALAAAVVGLGAALLIFCAAGPALAQRVVFEPERTQIVFHLDSTLHEIEGSARLAAGSVDFSPDSGVLRGRFVVDARSLETGNSLRDRSLHKQLLESERYPTIELLPAALEIGPSVDGVQPLTLWCEIQIHGAKHPLEITARLEQRGDEAHVQASFQIPHVAWGMRDMSNLLLRVDKQVTVEIDAVGRIVPDDEALGEPAPNAPHAPLAKRRRESKGDS